MNPRELLKKLNQGYTYQCLYCGWKTRSASRVCDRCITDIVYLKPLPKHILKKKLRQWCRSCRELRCESCQARPVRLTGRG